MAVNALSAEMNRRSFFSFAPLAAAVPLAGIVIEDRPADSGVYIGNPQCADCLYVMVVSSPKNQKSHRVYHQYLAECVNTDCIKFGRKFILPKQHLEEV